MEYYADIAIQILLLMMLASALNLLIGYAGETSMAQAAFYGFGAYTAGLLTLPVATGGVTVATSSGVAGGRGWPFWPAALVAVLVTFVVASLISIPALSRVRGEYLILLTLAFQLITSQLMSSLTSVTGGAFGLTPIPPISLFGHLLTAPSQVVWVIGGFAVLSVLLCYRLGESPFGRLLKGIREHESAVRAVGKDTIRPKVVVFGVAAGIAGLAGAFNAAYYQVAAPGSFDLDVSILAIGVVILGGVASPLGTILASILLGGLKPLLDALVGDDSIAWRGVIYGLALVLVTRFRPEGLIPEHAGLPARLRRTPTAGPTSAVGVVRHQTPLTEEPKSMPGDGTEIVLRITGLTKAFGGVHAVEDVSFELTRGRITALIGPNGAGKTTIFNLITATLRPDAGSVELNGADITGRSVHHIAGLGMARSFQDGRLFERLTALDNVAMAVPGQRGEHPLFLGLDPLGSRRAERQVRSTAAESLRFVGFNGDPGALVSELSYGEQKLVAIARLLATGSDVLLLDEPTSGVDPSAVEHVIDVIRGLREIGKTICLVEHSIHMVERLADRAVFLDQGRVRAQGSVADLMAQRDLTEIYFGN